jgi:hypothetical protein
LIEPGRLEISGHVPNTGVCPAPIDGKPAWSCPFRQLNIVPYFVALHARFTEVLQYGNSPTVSGGWIGPAIDRSFFHCILLKKARLRFAHRLPVAVAQAAPDTGGMERVYLSV